MMAIRIDCAGVFPRATRRSKQSTMSATQRLFREYRDINKTIGVARKDHVGPPRPSPSPDDDVDIILHPKSDTEMFSWMAYILGPPDSPYYGARFQLKIQVPQQY